MDFATLVRSNARHAPDKLALIVDDDTLTYRQLDERAMRLAGGMARLGIGKGDRVGIFLYDGVEWVETYLAASVLGAVPVAINFRYGRRELAHIVADSTLRLLFYDARLRELLDALDGLPERPRLVVQGAPTGDAIPYADLYGEPFAGRVRIAPTDWHTISYTSGTTGLPKGAIYTHLNTLLGGQLGNVAAWGLRSEDVILATTPLCHRVGQSRVINALGLGATLVVLPHFDPDRALDQCARYSVTVVSMVPTMARRLMEAAVRRGFRSDALRVLLFTGEAFPAHVRREIMAAFPGVECFSYFASTEAGLTANLSTAYQVSHASSVGRVVPGVEVRVVDDEGRDVPPGEAGELWIRSGEPGTFAVCAGYVHAPPEDEPRFVDGWYRSGDVGRFDAEGFLYIVDRKKDMVLSGGLNIASKEVEEVVAQHPAVAEAAVVGVPDTQYGEAVLAYVVLRPGAACSAADLIAHCRQVMASYKKPRYLEFVAELPRNPTGKVDKGALRERARAAAAAGELRRVE